MQRIALLVATLAIAVLAGCQGPEPTPGAPSPLPGPILGTRPPQTTEPVPTPPQVGPQIPQYPSSGVRLSDIIPPGGIRRGTWKVFVVHHSGAANATPQGMDRYHRVNRHWAGGLGYDFVIGNGVNYPDGALYVGPRWRAQETGAHCKSGAGRYLGSWRDANYFNEHGIGICLIGNFEQDRPTAKQMQTLQQLICLLSEQTGIGPTQIFGHGEITHKTACPGRYVSMPAVRRNVAAAMVRPSPPVHASSVTGNARVGR